MTEDGSKSQTVEQKVLEILTQDFVPVKGEISLETDLIKDLNMDSLGAVELFIDLKEEFNIEIPDEEIDNLRGDYKDSFPVNKLVNYITKIKDDPKYQISE